jgi:hypothetical protein
MRKIIKHIPTAYPTVSQRKYPFKVPFLLALSNLFRIY